ncbi:hypothetical protein BDQ94DRAFT_142373 [Aspergillus welwitschiae]|uniref:Uncharacterized protein n=1 Tax=Aspergillus welwitschiae TaxID=1341132 RepID=A0A3F3Q4T7_9EURO|nr:hypothetical protein BDQ94DRAFT_142373 [Aspergillus welwitschiae]RDH34244.1 hypothetical protein BDQ94DRAFT_142373 [Aspergillus welwitschiae]
MYLPTLTRTTPYNRQAAATRGRDLRTYVCPKNPITLGTILTSTNHGDTTDKASNVPTSSSFLPSFQIILVINL